MKSIFAIFLLVSLSSAFSATVPKVHFVKPLDKEFAVDGMTVAKAGDIKTGTGHHHLIIDGKPIPKGQVVPKDETHRHFGDAATSAEITLKPGKHTLTMQFADGVHKSLGAEYSTTISVEVK